MKISYPVLLVEDNLHAQYAARFLLQKADCQVCVAGNANDARAYLHNRYFALIVMDIGLPDDATGGVTLTQEIRDNPLCPNHETPVVALTAHYTSPDAKQQCQAAGMVDVLTKPVTPTNIANALSHLHPTDQLPIHDDQQVLACFPDALTADTTLQIFIGDLCQQRSRIQRLYAGKKWPALARTLHKQLGAALYCGTLRLNDCLKTLQTLLLCDNVDEQA